MRRKILHLITRPNDSLPAKVTEEQKRSADLNVVVIDLTVAHPDYALVLEQVFEADSIVVW